MMASKSFFAVIVAAISLFAALRLKESITNSAMKYKPSEEEENNVINNIINDTDSNTLSNNIVKHENTENELTNTEKK